MIFSMITKDGCPYCVKASALIKEKGDKVLITKVSTIAELQMTVPHAKTVPQIMSGDTLIGGYNDLVDYYADDTLEKARVLAPEKKRTVFNTENTGHITGDYPLFFGEALGFTDTVTTPYPIIELLYQAQLAQIWNEFEVDLTQDRQDMLSADPAAVALMVKTIMWQSLADSVASRSISSILSPFISNSDLEGWYNIVQFFETIHSRTYQHIIKQTFVNPAQALTDGYADMEVIKRADNLIAAFDEVINLDENAPLEAKQEAVYLAVIALYMLEAMNFMSSFAITFGIAETSIFSGIAENVSMICRDEMLHARGGKEVLLIEQRNNKKVFNKLKPKIQALFDSIIKDELAWTDHLFSEGRQCVGLNKERIKQYVVYMSQDVAKTLGIDCVEIKDNPLPYMAKYIDSSKVQNAMQEKQSGKYLVNAVLAPTDLPSLLSRLREEFNV